MNTTIIVSTAGDKATGIVPATCEIKFDFNILDDALASRDEFRRAFKAFFTEYDLFGNEEIGVRFSDECPDCGREMCKTTVSGSHETIMVCPNASCLSNQPVPQE